MPAFRPFGPDHWMALGVTASCAMALVAFAPRLRALRDDRLIRVGLALVVVGNELVSWIRALTTGRWGLPCHLCDLAVFLVAWALVGRNRVVGELALFWGLAGSSQAILTPDLHEGFPSYWWGVFFLGHAGIVLSALYLVVRGRVALTGRSVWRAWAISNGYVLIAGLLNWQLGTNFGYLAGKPDHPSLLDHLGPWPVYLLAIEVVALVLFFLCLVFSRAIDRWATRPTTA